MDHVFVTGDVKMTALITMKNYIKKTLQLVGFTTEEQRNSIYNYSIDSFIDIIMFTETYFSYLSTDFSRRTQDNVKIYFGMSRTKRMKTLLHWVQDFYPISGDPTIFDLN